jgi:hypothetical protein
MKNAISQFFIRRIGDKISITKKSVENDLKQDKK